MAEPFSRLVSSAAWRADVEEWVHDRVAEHGHRVTGPLDRRRTRAWSTQIVVPTDAGPLWFKANCSSMTFEPALHALLATVVPREVDAPYAIDESWEATAVTQPVNRAQTWADCLDGATEAELADWGNEPLQQLRQLLAA